MDRMPNELIDLMIDFLHKDTKSLRSCSTVCRTWSLSARHHLFERLRVSKPGQLSSIGRSSVPLSSVKTLWAGPKDFFGEFVGFGYKRRFTNLTGLTIFELYSPSLDTDEDLLNLCEELPLLRDLTLYGVNWFSLHNLMKFIHSFTFLSYLTLDYVTWEAHTTPFLYDPPASFPLRHLHIDDTGEELIETFIQMHPSLQIRTTFLPGTSGANYQRICETCHATLEKIDLCEIAPVLVENIDIKMFTALTTIALPLDPDPARVARVLQRVASNNIEHVLIFVLHWNPAVWEDWTSDYGLIETLMCTPRLRKAVLSIGVRFQYLAQGRSFFPVALPKLKLDGRARLRVEEMGQLCKMHGLNP